MLIDHWIKFSSPVASSYMAIYWWMVRLRPDGMLLSVPSHSIHWLLPKCRIVRHSLFWKIYLDRNWRADRALTVCPNFLEIIGEGRKWIGYGTVGLPYGSCPLERTPGEETGCMQSWHDQYGWDGAASWSIMSTVTEHSSTSPEYVAGQAMGLVEADSEGWLLGLSKYKDQFGKRIDTRPREPDESSELYDFIAAWN